MRHKRPQILFPFKPPMGLSNVDGLKAKTADDYASGYSMGIRWAEHDLSDSWAVSYGEAELREESQTDQRWARAFYLGALRGYREVVRSLRNGRWGT